MNVARKCRTIPARYASTVHHRPMQDYLSDKIIDLQVPRTKTGNYEPWARWLDEYLPPELRENCPESQQVQHEKAEDEQVPHEIPEDQLARSREVLDILTHTRSWKKDILNWLGFQSKRWPAVHAVLSSLLDSLDVVSKERRPLQQLSNLDWGSVGGLSLDEVTTKYGRDVLRNSRHLWRSTTHISLDTLTGRPYADNFATMLLGQVFRSLGDIVIEAADRPDEEAKVAMSYVFRILGRMHHSGYIPERIYTYTPADSELGGIHRPPGMHMLSTHIFNILSDAAWVDHEPTVTEGEKSPFIPFKMATRELGPEIWLEFILWCCVEHGLVLEASTLLKRMISLQNGGPWHFQSWEPLLQDPKLLFSTVIDSETVWRRGGLVDEGGTVFHGLGKRTISSELVASVVHNQMNYMFSGLGWRGLSAQYVLRDTGFLKRILAPSSGAEGFESPTRVVNSMVARFIESGGIEAHADPNTLSEFLREQTRVVPPWVHSRFDTGDKAAELSKSQLFNESSAFTGLMEYTVDSFADQSQTGLALTALGRLLNVIDTSKSRHLNKFFQRMGMLKAPNALSLDVDREVSAIPQMSNITFARLLDAARYSQEFAFADWLLSSQDVDSPVIPRSAYGDQVLVPALLRFAAVAGDQALYDQVVGSLQPPLALNTLKALLNVKVAFGQWAQVVELIEYIRDHRSKSWGSSNIVTLAVTIMRLDHSVNQPGQTPEAQESKSENLAQAKRILLRILNGEFNQRNHLTNDRYQRLIIKRICAVFSIIPGPLPELLCHVHPSYRVLSPDEWRISIPTIPINSFNELLAAVVDIHGSALGKTIWDRWLVDREPAVRDRKRRPGLPQRLFESGKVNYDKNTRTLHGQWADRGHGLAFPNLHSARIIARKAMEERAAQPEDPYMLFEPKLRAAERTGPVFILNFAVRRMKKMGLSMPEIDRETNNHYSWMISRGLLERRNYLAKPSDEVPKVTPINQYGVGLRIGAVV